MINKTTLAYGVFACVLVASAASGYGLSVLNRGKAVEQFQDRQLHTAHVIATTFRSEVGGLAQTLRAIADGVPYQDDEAVLKQLLDRQFTCARPPCFTSAAIYDTTKRLRYAWSSRAVGISDVGPSLEWARDPASRAGVRTLVSSSETPALVLLTPIAVPNASAGEETPPAPALLAGEVPFDAIFMRQPGVDERLEGSSTLVVDGAGNVLFHSSHPEMRLKNVRKRTAECFACHQTLDYVDRMLERQAGVVQYSLRGVPHLGAVASIDVGAQPWTVAVMGPAEIAVAVVSAQSRELGVLMLATVMSLVAAGHVTWKDRRRKLQAEVDAAHKADLQRSNAELTGLNARLESAAIEWRVTVDTIDASLMVLEPFGTIQRMNRAASDLLPGAPFAWLGQPSERLGERPPWDSALALARDALERDTIVTSRVHNEATGRTCDLWCRPSRRHGRPDAVVVVARDVTALVDLQESLRRSETMAALGSIVAGVAHEVRNPLFAISSLVDAWCVQKSADARPFQQALRAEVSRLKSLMNELLDYGTPSTSNPRPHPLSSIVHEAVRSCAHEAEARGVRIVTRPETVDADVWVDPQRFVRVLINLIQNGVQHAPAGSDVTLTVEGGTVDGRSGLHISVRDAGPGFREEDLSRVFTPFFSRRAGGFGLGLAISERIVAEHRGRMVAANHGGGGAVVTVILPPAPRRASEGAHVC